MYYAVTNHLFPKPDYVDGLVNGFATDRSDPITEVFGAPRFEMRRPMEGSEWLSTSIWSSNESFDTWRNSQAIRDAHRNVTSDPFERRAMLSFHDVVMNAAPGRAPVVGEPAAYARIEPGTFIILRRFYPKPEHADDVIAAFAALQPAASAGWQWWELWKVVKGEDWWSASYFTSEAEADAARAAGFAYLDEPGSADWYEKPAVESRYEVELERIPGMSATARRQPVGV